MRDSQTNGMGTSLRGCECQSLSTLANFKRSDLLPEVPDRCANDEVHIQRHTFKDRPFRPVGPDGIWDRPSRGIGSSAWLSHGGCCNGCRHCRSTEQTLRSIPAPAQTSARGAPLQYYSARQRQTGEDTCAMSRHLSVRIGDDVFAQLDAQSQRSGQSRSAVARRLLEEGLHMERHPGIVFRPGPGGRRAGLIDGPDVWEVVSALRGTDTGAADSLSDFGERTGLTTDQIRAALRYSCAYTDEVGAWIRRVDEEAERAKVQWRREQEVLGR